MDYKSKAIKLTNLNLRVSVEKFTVDPSAQNWARLTRAMKAHQFANFELAFTLEELLSKSPRFSTIDVLAEAFDQSIHKLEDEITNGFVRLVSAHR